MLTLARIVVRPTRATKRAIPRPGVLPVRLGPGPARVCGFDITNCDIKACPWRAAQTPVGLYRTRRGHALQRPPLAPGGPGQRRDHAGFRPAGPPAGDPRRIHGADHQAADTVQLHDEQIKAIAQVLRQMKEKPPEPPKGRIGFQPPSGATRRRRTALELNLGR
jgi:hypothetical protein